MIKKQTANALIAALIVNTLFAFSMPVSAQSLLDEPKPELRGTAQTDYLHAYAYVDGVRIGAHCRRESAFRCVHLAVTNGSDDPIVIYGDKAEATDAKGNAVRVSTFDQVKHHTGCGLNGADWAWLELVAFGTGGFGKVVMEEWMEPHKDLGVAAGRDGWEHAVEVQRWGRIMVTPGNTAEACLYFPRGIAEGLKTLRMPVATFTQQPTSGQLVVSISVAPSGQASNSAIAPNESGASETSGALTKDTTTVQMETQNSTQTITKTQTPDVKATTVQTTTVTPTAVQTTTKTTTETPAGTNTTTQTKTEPIEKTIAPIATPPNGPPEITPNPATNGTSSPPSNGPPEVTPNPATNGTSSSPEVTPNPGTDGTSSPAPSPAPSSNQ